VHYATLFQNPNVCALPPAISLLFKNCGEAHFLRSDTMRKQKTAWCTKRLCGKTRDCANKKENAQKNKNMCGQITYHINEKNVQSAFHLGKMMSI
jgi:hypothetical protein